MKVSVVTDERYPDYYLSKGEDSAYSCIEMTEEEFSQWENAVKEYDRWSGIIERRLEESRK